MHCRSTNRYTPYQQQSKKEENNQFTDIVTTNCAHAFEKLSIIATYVPSLRTIHRVNFQFNLKTFFQFGGIIITSVCVCVIFENTPFSAFKAVALTPFIRRAVDRDWRAVGGFYMKP